MLIWPASKLKLNRFREKDKLDCAKQCQKNGIAHLGPAKRNGFLPSKAARQPSIPASAIALRPQLVVRWQMSGEPILPWQLPTVPPSTTPQMYDPLLMYELLSLTFVIERHSFTPATDLLFKPTCRSVFDSGLATKLLVSMKFATF